MKITIEIDSIEQLNDLLNYVAVDLRSERHVYQVSIDTDKDLKARLRHPRGVCQKCGAPLAKGSRSYCRKHENERIKEWRKAKKQSA